MKIRLLLAPLAIALVASLAACGGSSSVPSNDVATVDGQGITLATFNGFFKEALGISKLQGVTLQPGTPGYTQKRDQTLAYAVEIAEVEQQAPKEKVHVSEADVTKFIQNIAKTKYGGSMSKLVADFKGKGLDMATLRDEVRINLIANKIKAKVTATATVSTQEEQQYYNQNIASYHVPAATTRQVAHILVKTKALANTIEQKLAHGADFAKLAKQYSIDTSSATNGGKLCIAQPTTAGTCIQTVPPFSKAAFALKTGQVSAPVQSQYGWHVIKAIGAVVHQKAHVQTFADVQASIKSTLLSQKQETLWQQWLADLAKQYQGKVSYQAGYAPQPTTAISTTPTT